MTSETTSLIHGMRATTSKPILLTLQIEISAQKLVPLTPRPAPVLTKPVLMTSTGSQADSPSWQRAQFQQMERKLMLVETRSSFCRPIRLRAMMFIWEVLMEKSNDDHPKRY